VSAALVAVTEQVPADVTLSEEPETAQPVAVPSTTANDTAPVPEPPLVISVSAVPKVPLVDVTVSAAWIAGAKVTVVGFDEIEAKVESPALVAVTVQVPADVALSEEPDTAHPVAVPSAAVNETAPVPEPPLVVSVSEPP